MCSINPLSSSASNCLSFPQPLLDKSTQVALRTLKSRFPLKEIDPALLKLRGVEPLHGQGKTTPGKEFLFYFDYLGFTVEVRKASLSPQFVGVFDGDRFQKAYKILRECFPGFSSLEVLLMKSLLVQKVSGNSVSEAKVYVMHLLVDDRLIRISFDRKGDPHLFPIERGLYTYPSKTSEDGVFEQLVSERSIISGYAVHFSPKQDQFTPQKKQKKEVPL